MTQASDTAPETGAVRVDKDVRHIYPSKLKNYLLIGAALLVVGAGLAIYIAICVADIRHNMAMDELKSRSQAHSKILSAYSQGAEMDGIDATVVKSVLVEAELVPGTVPTL